MRFDRGWSNMPDTAQDCKETAAPEEAPEEIVHADGGAPPGEASEEAIRPGGGACAIRRSNVCGMECQVAASTSCIVTDSGGSVDFGCPVDADLLADGENPYVSFYDLDILSEKMNEFFGEVSANAA